MKKFLLIIIVLKITISNGQIVYRSLPGEWEKLVLGGNFMDRILPMPKGELSSDVWGAKVVIPRYIDNGIEDDTISYWGGNIVKEAEDKYHFFLCGWREDNPDGHMGYKNYSTQYHAIADNSVGPFKVVEELGKGHNTEILQLKNGKYLIYHVTGGEHDKHCNYLISDQVNGPWEKHVLPLDLRDREVRLGGGSWFHNMTFTKREDGSVLMLSRCGSIWVSETGTSPYHLITTKSIYPMVAGRYEDPVIWKDHIQYHAIVNDWIGRTAFYMRSKNGIDWVVEEGRAYIPGVSVHEDGTKEEWYKYERMRMYQDDYGRAIQANFAVIDANKHEDCPNDKHSSKNISLPLNPGMLLTIESKSPYHRKTKEIKVRIKAEKHFNPNEEVDIASLRFGASSEVNYGRGAKAIKGEKDGDDLIVIFEAKNHYISDEVFAPKMLGKNKKGKMLYGYARLPWIDFITPILSARKPNFKKGKAVVVVENHGQIKSKPTFLTLYGYGKEGTEEEWGDVLIPTMKAYGKVELKIKLNKNLVEGEEYPVVLKIASRTGNLVLFRTKISL